jgi:hypothetical protein
MSAIAVERPTNQPTNQHAYNEIQRILGPLPDEEARKFVIWAVLTKRCKECFAYDPSEQFECCQNARGGRR